MSTITPVRTRIAVHIKIRRGETKTTQLQLANATGISIATIKRIESGKMWANSRDLALIAHYLQMGIVL